MSHHYLEEYYDPADEPVAKKPFQYEVIDLFNSGESFHKILSLVWNWWSADQHIEGIGILGSGQIQEA